MTEGKMVWVDVETTGLDARQDVILEIGVRVTDEEGTSLSERQLLTFSPAAMSELENASAFVKDMHMSSGLTADLRGIELLFPTWQDASKIHGHAVVANDLFDWLTIDLGLEPGVMPMCGSTVGFDRKFIEIWMPKFGRFFNHRHIDVSTLNELAKILNPRIYESRPQGPGKHRPLSDLDDSIATYRYYKDEFLFVEGSLPGVVEA